MDTEELKYWVGFSQITKLGPLRFKKLINYFPDLKTAWQTNYSELIKSGLEPELAAAIDLKKSEINPDEELKKLAKEKIEVVTLKDKNYPKLLSEIYDAPPLLYFRGELTNPEFALAVVGTRKISSYGQQVVPQIVKDLAGSGLIIVSGLALGVDALAHQSTLEVSGYTIAVLGSGLDWQNIYPADNRYLAKKIINAGGSVISEYPIGTPPLKHHFPYRNRIISGLTLGTLVIEAPASSGALITAKYALEQNREIFAVPGSIFSQNSEGPNNLIKMGARLVSSAADILEALNLNQITEFKKAKKIIADSLEEEILLKNLSYEPIHIDKLAELSRINTSILNSTLTLMEMKGKIRNLGGNNYVRAR